MKPETTYQIRFKTKSKLLEATVNATVLSNDQARAVKLATEVLDKFVAHKAKEGLHIVYKIEKVTRVSCDIFLIDDQKTE